MANAKALFKRHYKEYLDAWNESNPDVPKSRMGVEESALIYGACILVEAIKNEEEVDMKYIAQRDNGK